MRIGSLFAGIGGLELGLEWAGVGHTVWQVEKDPYCRQVLAEHWPDATRYDDVCTVGAHNLAPVDVICGGFPCQDISYAGKGAGLEGARSGLWYEFARIIGEMGPRYVVVENVRALLTRGIDQVLGTLADLGYDAEWSTLRASDVGAPHRRERVFLIAWLQGVANAGSGRFRGPTGGEGQFQGGAEAIGGSVACVAYASGQHGAQPHGWALRSEQRAPRRGDDSRRGADAGDADGGRCERRRAEQRADAVAGAGYACLGDAGGTGWSQFVAAAESGHAGHAAGERRRVGVWSDGVAVEGFDGTVRLIPEEAATEGAQSPLWPVVDGVPGRVARLRAIGNAVVPACAEVVGRRLLEIDAGYLNPITGPLSPSSS